MQVDKIVIFLLPDFRNHLLLFSSFDKDGHFESNITDESFDLNKVIQTQMMIEAVRDAISKLSDEERNKKYCLWI